MDQLFEIDLVPASEYVTLQRDKVVRQRQINGKIQHIMDSLSCNDTAIKQLGEVLDQRQYRFH
jgi:hypothetical protein